MEKENPQKMMYVHNDYSYVKYFCKLTGTYVELM